MTVHPASSPLTVPVVAWTAKLELVSSEDELRLGIRTPQLKQAGHQSIAYEAELVYEDIVYFEVLFKGLRITLVEEARKGVRILIHSSRRPCRGEDDEAEGPLGDLILEPTCERGLACPRGSLELGTPLKNKLLTALKEVGFIPILIQHAWHCA